jgi:hypothetical protein
VSLPEKILVHGAAITVGVTGLAYAVFKYLLVNDDPFSAVNHPLQPWALSLHVLSAPLLIFALGLVFREHVIAGMKGRLNAHLRRAGLATLSLLLLLIASGYLIQVLAGETLRRWTAWIHAGLGVVFIAAYAAHILCAAARARAASGALQRASVRAPGLSPSCAARQEAAVESRR